MTTPFTLSQRPLLASLLAAGLLAAPAYAVNINNQYLDANYGGVLGDFYDRANTMPNVAAIFVDDEGEGHGQWCSGSLIHPRVILTAAHCVADDSDEVMNDGMDTLEVRFSPTPATVSSPHDRRVRDIVFHQEYFQDDDRDLALISLGRPIHGIQPVQLAPEGFVVAKESLATIVGYGLAGTGTNPGRPWPGSVPLLEGYDDSKRRIAVTRIGNVTEDIIQAQFRDPARPDVYNQYGLTSPIPVDQGEPEGGDSGGPLFVQTPSGWLQIGTVMRGGGGDYGDAGYGSSDDWTFVPFYSDWITANLVALLSAGVETAQLDSAAAGTVRRWSDASAWSDRIVPGNQAGSTDPETGLWQGGTYYEVEVNSGAELIVDQNVTVDSLQVNHGQATLDVRSGQELYTVLDSHVVAGELKVNGVLDSDAVHLSGGRLSGNGVIRVATRLHQSGGVLAPGRSPGILTVEGDVTQSAGARLEVEIDGTGIGTGAGNYDRLLMTGAYTAGGTISPVLRGIAGSANNNFTPDLGQRFEVVGAEGGVSGSFASLEQPSNGLASGTRLDTVYASNSVSLYATPASYSELGAAGVSDSANRQSLGRVLDAARPLAGVRASDAAVEQLYDALAPQTRSSLPAAMDRLGGVGYAQMIQSGFETSKFLVEQTDLVLAAQRRGDALAPLSQARAKVANDETASFVDGRHSWATAIGRLSSQKANYGGYKTTDTLAGVMGGMQWRLDSATTVGYSLAYVHGRPDVEQGMASGRSDTMQLTVHANRELSSGYFVQGSIGAGIGRTRASRYVPLTQSSHEARIKSSNVAASGVVGWASAPADQPRFEVTSGLRYMAYHYRGFDDSNAAALSALSAEGDTLQSIQGVIGVAASMPFGSGPTAWRTSIWSQYGHEFGDRHATMKASLLGGSYSQHSSNVGRDRVSAGLLLSGQLSKRTALSLGISGELAKDWKAASASLGLKVAF